MSNQYTVNIDGNQVTSKKSVKLLNINTDCKFFFDKHFSLLCKNLSNNLAQ